MNNIQKYNQAFIDVFKLDESQLDDELSYGSIKKWDSIAHLTLITRLEDDFDIMFDSEDILGFGSYGNGKKILLKYKVEF